MKLTSRLSRSAIDATRFTATSPHAYSKPSPLRSIAPSSSSTTAATPNAASRSNTSRTQLGREPTPNPAPKFRPPMQPPGANSIETPAEKVARLRAARMREREAQVSRWERIVVRGRSWADTAHKATVYFLVTFSGMLSLFSYASGLDCWNASADCNFVHLQSWRQ